MALTSRWQQDRGPPAARRGASHPAKASPTRQPAPAPARAHPAGRRAKPKRRRRVAPARPPRLGAHRHRPTSTDMPAGAGRFQRRDHLVAACEAVVTDRLDAAGFEEILGKARARGEVRRRAEIGEEDFRPRAGAREHAVGGIAQLLERLGEPDAWQRLDAARDGDGRRATAATSSTETGGFGKVGKIAGAGERVLAARHGGKTLVANGSDFLLDQALFERGPCAAGRVRSPETRSMPRCRAAPSAPRCRRSRRWGRRPARDWIPRAGTSCVLRAMRRAKRSGSPSGSGERQHRDGVGTAQARGDDRDGCAQHVHIRIALGHHSPGGLGRDEGAARVRARRPPRRAPTIFAARETWRWSGTGRHRR